MRLKNRLISINLNPFTDCDNLNPKIIESIMT